MGYSAFTQYFRIGKKGTMSQKFVSFDVFDTVISRETATPIGIFCLIERKLQKGDYDVILPIELITDFARNRVISENCARAESKFEEITISEIYINMGTKFGLTDNSQKNLIDIEISEEINSVYGVNSTINEIQRLRNEGHQILFISDTYLPESVIREMLIKVGAYREEDCIYVSDEHRVTKRTGNLFKLVLKEKSLSSRDLLHIGDNCHSDIAIPKSIGIPCTYFHETVLNQYENAIINCSDNGEYNLQMQILAGASKKVRLTDPNCQDERNASLNVLGACVAGPILFGYCFWILNNIRDKRIKTAYFVARDGQIVFEICKRLYQKIAPATQLRYLYGSRQAWHLPSITNIGERELNWILEADPYLTIKIIAKRLEITPEDIIRALKKNSTKIWSITEELCQSDIDEIKVAFRDPDLYKLIEYTANQYRENAIEYFKQEGLFDKSSWVMVDLGWLGRLQDSLGRILQHSGDCRTITGLYFGLDESPFIVPHQEKNSYFYNSSCDSQYRRVGREFANFLEIFTAADHGSTLSYHFDTCKGKWKPNTMEEKNKLVIEWGLEVYREGLLRYIDSISNYIEYFTPDDLNLFKKCTARIMEQLLSSPEQNLAETIGDFPFSSDQVGSNMRKFAPPLSIMQFLTLNRISYPDILKVTYWKKGSIARSNKAVILLSASQNLIQKALYR